MLTREELQTAQDFLAAAEREFALGELLAGEVLLADAAVNSIKTLAKRLGWPHGNDQELLDVLRRLDGESEAPALTSRYQMIKAAPEMVRSGYSAGSEFEDSWRDFLSAREFVERLEALDGGQ